MSPRYQHTQIGWVIIVSLVGFGAPLGALLATEVPGTLLMLVVGLLALALPLFATLTVTIDDEALRLRFGVGLIRKRVPLSQIRSASVVENPWYYGWGIHGFPGGVLYNVSGTRAVELVLADGKRARVGTDEPEELMAVLEQAVGKLVPQPGGAVPQSTSKRRGWALLAGALVLLLVVGIVGSIIQMSRPVRARVQGDRLIVTSFIYGDEYPLASVTSVELLPSLPAKGIRTNGLALGPTLRGWFRLEGLGDGKVFVQADRPPFVLVRLQQGFVLVGFESTTSTRTLYDTLVAATEQPP